MKHLIYILTLLILFTVAASAQTKAKLTEAEAAARFEQFVIDNGYTDLPPTEDKSKLVEEPVNGGIGEFEIRSRRNMLERTPYEVFKGNRIYADGWTAVFIYKQSYCKDCQKGTARLVFMDAYGENLRFEHQDFIIKKLKKKNKTR